MVGIAVRSRGCKPGKVGPAPGSGRGLPAISGRRPGPYRGEGGGAAGGGGPRRARTGIGCRTGRRTRRPRGGSGEIMLTFTDRAREMVRAFMTQGEEGDLEALRIGVEGSPVAPRFELTLVSRTDRRDDEREVDLGDFAVLVSEASLERLDGATVD